MPAADRPALSVVIPTWCAEDTIGACLGSLVAQKNAPEFEVLVVDSSPDGATREAAESFARSRGGQLDLQILDLENRAFPGTARNLGVEKARAERILFLDADVRAARDLVCRAANSLAAGAVAVGGSIGLRQGAGVSARLRHIFEFKESLPGVPARATWKLPTACLAVDRAVFLRYGGFPDTRASEDWLFDWALWQGGETMCFDPDLRVLHDTRAGWAEFFSYARLLGRASGAARPVKSSPGQLSSIRTSLSLKISSIRA